MSGANVVNTTFHFIYRLTTTNSHGLVDWVKGKGKSLDKSARILVSLINILTSFCIDFVRVWCNDNYLPWKRARVVDL